MKFFFQKWKRFLIQKLRLPNDETNARLAMDNIRLGVSMYGAPTWILIAAVFIASLGLNTNSTAVIIGAMLISPLMGPILGFGLALGISDAFLLRKSIRNFILMVVVSVITSTLFFWISPMKEPGSELLGRTSPTIYDVLIAFVGGAAGIVAGASRLRASNVIPGVAIATALMPPLCTIGFGIANLQWKYVGGAFYLFMINCVFICFATYIIVRALGYSQFFTADNKKKKNITWLMFTLILLTAAPSIYLTYHLTKKYFFQERVEAFIRTEIADGNHHIVSKQLDYAIGGKPSIQLVMLGDILTTQQKDSLKLKLNDYQLEGCTLEIFQGSDSRVMMEGMINKVNNDVKSSVNDLYLRLDSLQTELDKRIIQDSVRASIAYFIKSKDSTLTSFALDRKVALDLKTNTNDTTWVVSLSFAKDNNLLSQDSIRIWLWQKFQLRRVVVQYQ